MIKVLKHGDVLVKVDYSTLNFKDALILKNGARLVKEFPHIPGIDFSEKLLKVKAIILKKVTKLFKLVGESEKFITEDIHNTQK